MLVIILLIEDQQREPTKKAGLATCLFRWLPLLGSNHATLFRYAQRRVCFFVLQKKQTSLSATSCAIMMSCRCEPNKRKKNKREQPFSYSLLFGSPQQFRTLSKIVIQKFMLKESNYYYITQVSLKSTTDCTKLRASASLGSVAKS